MMHSLSCHGLLLLLCKFTLFQGLFNIILWKDLEREKKKKMIFHYTIKIEIKK